MNIYSPGELYASLTGDLNKALRMSPHSETAPGRPEREAILKS